MLNFSKSLELPPQLQWRYENEPELLAWTIRARNYNTFVANLMFAFMVALIFGGSLIMYSVYAGMSQPWRTLSCIFFFIFISFTISCMTHQRMNFAYRFTKSGLEYCEWKDFPKWALTFLKWFSVVTAIIFIYLATIDPTFLIGALIGPGGMGLIYLSMASSKNFQRMHTEYHHYFLHWRELTKSTEATNRVMIELEYKVPKKDSIYMTIGRQYVFFTSKQKEQVCQIVKSNLLSSTPYVVEKVDVLN
ncbi:hypothetical protein [Pseudomonas sp. ICMP 460]|uniref:hypothetical protein n=1 Tax=Pseudomonas sp. ICMP 460 TaxID=1718917 RepID=UPI000C087DB7|nr:hypothetical protein [Pseudomonas sp. ICMP 460]PHN26819.1 hypothetical protein AO240_01015 [Pseudomonas sp. ICMP 460]